ncbi:uncharacterized protein C8Q71DRAFT_807439 [Rhodofomes roseus]|uniref:Uncharacterized protein n=1 Tax=Rhodofomes roseus TaxID=34475 RepID=A0ABQ8KK96_9APHY|nr:uncharacterized protein C8Q71DRAFT_807439 [Rhodofomes roseus]KAH9838506.1 hypothetical protein C8Q71DRAFT_807439 [Rhodofomes roseus]
MHVRHHSDPALEIYTPRGGAVVYSTRPRFESGEFTPLADPVARLTRECSALRLRLATAERRERSAPFGPLTAPVQPRTPPSARFELALETAYARRDAARSHIHIEIMKLAERYKALQETLREMQENLRTKDREIETLRQERDRLVAERDQVRVERDQARTERDEERMKNQRVSPESGVVENREQNGVQHPNRRRSRTPSRSRAPRRIENAPPVPQKPQAVMDAEQIARTRSMDVFMTKTDNWSGAQVIQAVEDLNAEINQFAASATETCAFTKRMKARAPPPTSDTGPLQDEESAPWLGAAFVQALSTRDHTQDPILVQLALQASIVTCCARSLSLFCVGFPSKLDALLSRVLTHMQSSEPQATSARWRALTHRSIRMLYPGLEEYAITELVATMLRWSSTVFALAGSSPTTEPSPALVPSTQLRRIAEAVYRLARVTREEILSTSFEVVLVDSGEPFEEGSMSNKMRDYEECIIDDATSVQSYSSGRSSGARAGGANNGRVLCTTELGLRCVTRKSRRASTASEDNVEEPFEDRILLTPKVVLNSALEAIDRGQ